MQNSSESETKEQSNERSKARKILEKAAIVGFFVVTGIGLVAKGKVEYDMDLAIRENLKNKALQEQLSSQSRASQSREGDIQNAQTEAPFLNNAEWMMLPAGDTTAIESQDDFTLSLAL